MYVYYLAVIMSDAAKVCSKCGAEVSSQHRFCSNCGDALVWKSEFDAEKEIQDQPKLCASGSSSSFNEKGISKSDETLGGVNKRSDDDDHSMPGQSPVADSQLNSEIQTKPESREFNNFISFCQTQMTVISKCQWYSRKQNKVPIAELLPNDFTATLHGSLTIKSLTNSPVEQLLK